MKITTAELEKKYQELSDIEIFELHQSGDLTDIAIYAIEKVMKERNITEKKVSSLKDSISNKKKENITKANLPQRPKALVGYFIAIVFFGVQVLSTIKGEGNNLNYVAIFLSVTGGLYWLLCVKQIHSILNFATMNEYPISAGKAAAMHFVPIFNFYWVFKWPIELSKYINSFENIKMIHGSIIGFLIIVGMVIRIIDSTLGMIWMFTIIFFLNKKIQAVVDETVKR